MAPVSLRHLRAPFLSWSHATRGDFLAQLLQGGVALPRVLSGALEVAAHQHPLDASILGLPHPEVSSHALVPDGARQRGVRRAAPEAFGDRVLDPLGAQGFEVRGRHHAAVGDYHERTEPQPIAELPGRFGH